MCPGGVGLVSVIVCTRAVRRSSAGQSSHHREGGGVVSGALGRVRTFKPDALIRGVCSRKLGLGGMAPSDCESVA